MKPKNLIQFPIILSVLIAFSAVAKEEAVKISGSLRYRHEMIDEEKKDMRNRHRIAAKAKLTAKVTETVKAAIEIASGEKNSGTSSNATLTDGFNKKDLYINQAVITYTCNKLTGLSLNAGKFKNPFAAVGKSELVWDSDIVSEGISTGYEREYSKFSVFTRAGFFWVQEIKSDEDDKILIGGQLGGSVPMGGLSFTIGGGYYHYEGLKGASLIHSEKGNSVSTDTNYVNDYGIVEGFGELGIKAGPIPIKAFGHFVMNTEADKDNSGFLAGLKVGKAKKPGTVEGRAYYKYLEKDAVFGALADSDFGGGGSNNSGVEINLKLALAKKMSVAATYFINEKGLDNGKSYQRGQLDCKVKF